MLSNSDVSDCSPIVYIAHQAPPSMGFPRQEYWSQLPFPPPGDLLNLRWQADSLLLSHLGRPEQVIEPF